MNPSNFHTYRPADGHGLMHDPFRAIVAPRPIGWISSRSAAGVLNLAPYSFFNAFSTSPPIIGFASSTWKDTVQNIRETGEFGWSLASRPLAEPMNLTSGHYPPDVDEFDLAGLTPAPGLATGAAWVAESPASFECRLTEIVRLKTAAGVEIDSWMVLGEVVVVHIDKRMIDGGVFQTERAQPIMRAGGRSQYYGVDSSTGFHMLRPRGGRD